jgi:hypothetical protein
MKRIVPGVILALLVALVVIARFGRGPAVGSDDPSNGYTAFLSRSTAKNIAIRFL